MVRLNKREYLIAKGTIDEYFHQLVEEKRQIFGETIGINWSLENDSNAVRDLSWMGREGVI